MEAEDLMLEMEIVSKKREEFDFRRDFELKWKLDKNENARTTYTMMRSRPCEIKTPAMFPDVQLNYTDTPVIFFCVPK